MLIQTHRGEIHILPALPAAWSDGAVTGLRARGAVTVDIAWQHGAVCAVTLHADRASAIRIRSTLLDGPFELTDAASEQTIPAEGTGAVRQLAAEAGHTYLLRQAQAAR